MRHVNHPKRRFTRFQRTSLYLETDGKCAACGCLLAAGWHADHVVPFSRGGTTSLSNGQPLCPDCNRKKGSRLDMTTARPFQIRAEGVLQVALAKLKQMAASGKIPALENKVVVCNVFPASGKTQMSLLGANLAWTLGHIDTAVYMVPRVNLAGQIENGWNRYRKDNSGAPLMSRILQAENVPPLLRYKDQFGYATTYSALVSNPALHLNFFQNHSGRVMLVLDEAQILGCDSATNEGTQAAQEVKRLVDYAALIMLMTGTPYRADGNPLLLARYSNPDPSGKIYLQSDVEATYLEGVAEGYIRPLEADLINADVDLKDLRTGTVDATRLDEMERGLRQVLCDARFYGELVDRTVNRVCELKQLWPYYCGLIGAVDQNHAREIEKYLKRTHPHMKTLLAISDEANAQNNLALFRNGGYDLLITVGMAFIGFDHPPISVVCCLSGIREQGWLQQFFARGMRMTHTGDPELDEAQRVFIIAPNDPAMREMVEALRLDSDLGLAQKQQMQAATGGLPVMPLQPTALTVENVSITEGTAMGLDPENDVTPEEYTPLDTLRKHHKMGPVGLSTLKGFAKDVQAMTKTTGSGTVAAQVGGAPDQAQTALEIEKAIRREIKGIQGYTDRLLGAPNRVAWGHTFEVIALKFGFTVSKANADDLHKVLKWLRSDWIPNCERKANGSNGQSADA